MGSKVGGAAPGFEPGTSCMRVRSRSHYATGAAPKLFIYFEKNGGTQFLSLFFLQNSQAGPGRLRHQQVAAHVRGRGREGLHRRTVRAGETISHKKLIGINIISFKNTFADHRVRGLRSVLRRRRNVQDLKKRNKKVGKEEQEEKKKQPTKTNTNSTFRVFN